MLDIITASAKAYGTTARTCAVVTLRRSGRTQATITPAAITRRIQTAPRGPAATKAVVAIAVPNRTLAVDASTGAMGRQRPNVPPLAWWICAIASMPARALGHVPPGGAVRA